MARLRRRRGPLGFLRTLNTLAYLPLASRAPTYGRLVYALLRDDRIAWSKKAVLAVAAGYVVSPIDFVPEMIPILGALDDVAVIVLALDIFIESVPRTLLNEKLAELEIDPAELEHDLEQVRRYAGLMERVVEVDQAVFAALQPADIARVILQNAVRSATIRPACSCCPARAAPTWRSAWGPSPGCRGSPPRRSSTSAPPSASPPTRSRS